MLIHTKYLLHERNSLRSLLFFPAFVCARYLKLKFFVRERDIIYKIHPGGIHDIEFRFLLTGFKHKQTGAN